MYDQEQDEVEPNSSICCGLVAKALGFFMKALGSAALTGIEVNGLAVHKSLPCKPAPESLRRKTVIITEGNAGLGFDSAKRLAMGGAKVIITSCDPEKGAKAVESIKQYVSDTDASFNSGGSLTNDVDVYFLHLDLSDLESVKGFPKALQQIPGFQSADVLLNNAGVLPIPNNQTIKGGDEQAFETNHLGHFVLTAGMTPLLNPVGSRVVTISSMAYSLEELNFNSFNKEYLYSPLDLYDESKLENILFTRELQRRATDAGKKITAVALHPGTGTGRKDLIRFVAKGNNLPTQDVTIKGVDRLKQLPLKCFTSRQLKEEKALGASFSYINMKETKVSPTAPESEKAKELWRISERRSGIEFSL